MSDAGLPWILPHSTVHSMVGGTYRAEATGVPPSIVAQMVQDLGISLVITRRPQNLIVNGTNVCGVDICSVDTAADEMVRLTDGRDSGDGMWKSSWRCCCCQSSPTRGEQWVKLDCGHTCHEQCARLHAGVAMCRACGVPRGVVEFDQWKSEEPCIKKYARVLLLGTNATHTQRLLNEAHRLHQPIVIICTATASCGPHTVDAPMLAALANRNHKDNALL